MKKAEAHVRPQLHPETAMITSDQRYAPLQEAATDIAAAYIVFPCELEINAAVRNGDNVNLVGIFDQIELFKGGIGRELLLITDVRVIDIKCAKAHCDPLLSLLFCNIIASFFMLVN